MARSQIGAVIGIEGATEFSNNMRILARETKEFASEMKALTSSFDANNRTIKGVSQQREILNKQLKNANERLYQQKAALDKVNAAAKTADVTDDRWAATHDKLQTEINQTTAEINKYEQELKNLPSTSRMLMDAWNNSTSDLGELMKGIGDTLTRYVTLPLAAGAGVAVKTAISYQSAFTGVKKTVDEAVDANGNLIYSYDDLNAVLKEIPLRTASSYQTVAAVAEAAGQLGIAIQDIPGYAETIIMLGDSTNISAEEASTAIAQFLNIMGEGVDTVDDFGGSLVALGNNTATDEASIMRLATRLASAGHLVGLSTPQILGLSAAMSSVGLTAEAGGTAMSQAMTKISKAVANGGESLELFGEVTGRTGQEFADLWRNEPIKAIEEFLIGLSNLEGGSEELILMLDELGFSGIRESDTLRRLTSDYDGVSAAVALAEENYKGYNLELGENNALSEEARKRYETWESQISQLKEALLQLADEIGQDLLPDLMNLVDWVKDLVEKWRNLNPETKQAWINLGKVLAVIGPILSIGGNLLIWAAKLKGAFAVLKGAEGIGGVVSALGGGKGGLGTALSKAGEYITTFCGSAGLGTLISTLSAAAGAAGLLGMVIYALTTDQKLTDEQVAAIQWADEMGDSIDSVKQDWSSYNETVSTVLGANGELLDANTLTVKNNAEESSSAVHMSMEEARESVRSNMISISDIIGTEGTNASNNMSTKMAEAKASVQSNMTDIFSLIASNSDSSEKSLNSAFGMMKKDVVSHTGSMKGQTSSAFSAIAGTIRTKMSEFVTIIKNEGRRAEGEYKLVLTGIEGVSAPDLSSTGGHMMETLAGGIRAHAHSVISAASNIAGRIAAYLKFSEPEEGPLSDFHVAMPDMMKLMAKGINDNMYLVEDALDNVSGMMASKLDAGASNVSYGGIVINMNVPQGTDGRSLVDQIENEIANRTMRRRMVFN